MNNYEREINLFCTYLVNKPATKKQLDLYTIGIKCLHLELNANEEKMLETMFRRRYLIGAIDAGLSFFNRNSNLKKRILLTSCILECDVNEVSSFLNHEKSSFRFLKFIFYCFRAGINIFTSYFIFKLKKWM